MYTENKMAKIKNLEGGIQRKILSYSENLMACELYFEKGAIGAIHSHQENSYIKKKAKKIKSYLLEILIMYHPISIMVSSL